MQRMKQKASQRAKERKRERERGPTCNLCVLTLQVTSVANFLFPLLLIFVNFFTGPSAGADLLSLPPLKGPRQKCDFDQSLVVLEAPFHPKMRSERSIWPA